VRFLYSQNYERRLLASSCLSVRSHGTTLVHTGRIFVKFCILNIFFKICLENSSVYHYNLAGIMGTVHEDVRTFTKVSRWIFHRMKNVSDESCRENLNTHFTLSNIFPKTVPFVR